MIEIAEGKLSDDLRDTIKNTNECYSFSRKGKSDCFAQSEVNKMLGKMDEMAEAGGVSMSEPFIVGETSRSLKDHSMTLMV